MRFGIAVFPGTWSDGDCARAVEVLGHESVRLWHRERDLQGSDCVILPGGFAYGDHLRTGAVARFAPLMEAVQEFAAAGGLVLGICNGFQILCEAHLLPGALTRNASLEFRCETTWLRVETVDTPFTRDCERGGVLAIPVSHGEGRFVADPSTLDRLEAEQRVAFQMCIRDSVQAVQETVGDEGRFFHLGLTSSDVVDTALATQLRDAARQIDDDAAALEAALALSLIHI